MILDTINTNPRKYFDNKSTSILVAKQFCFNDKTVLVWYRNDPGSIMAKQLMVLNSETAQGPWLQNGSGFLIGGETAHAGSLVAKNPSGKIN